MSQTCKNIVRHDEAQVKSTLLVKNVVRDDETPVKSTLLSGDKNILSSDMSFMSRRNDIML